MRTMNGWRVVAVSVILTMLASPEVTEGQTATQEAAQRRKVEALRQLEVEQASERDSLLRERDRFLRELALQEDPAGAVYREAREALRAHEYERAAQLFSLIRESYPKSGYVADSYYYQAMALQRSGRVEELQKAAELLAVQEAEYRSAAEAQEARALAIRIRSELARRGNAESYAYMQQQAEQQCGGEDEVRMAALSALVRVDAEKARPILLEMLEERGECSGELRQQAIFLLAQSGEAPSPDLLVDLARNDPSPEVRAAAVFWLGQTDGPGTTEALEALLEGTTDPEVQAQAFHALARRSDRGAAEMLLRYARRTDLDPEIRAQAVFTLAQTPGAETDAALRELYGTVEGELKSQVLFGLSRSGGSENTEFLQSIAMDPEEDSEVRMNALFWLAQHGEGIEVAELTRMYRQTSDLELKQHVLMLVARLGEAGGVDLLIEAARDPDHPELREQAVFLLGQSGDPRAADALMELIRGG